MQTQSELLKPLDNIVWHVLTGPMSRFAKGDGGARRFAEGYSPIIAFENLDDPDFESLRETTRPGETFFLSGWQGAIPAGWRLDREVMMQQMVWDGRPVEAKPDPDGTRPLVASDGPQALELAKMTHPGPFGVKTLEFGDYYGVFEGERLVSMAGERFHCEGLREVSGVCTHPDRQGRGLAKALMLKLIRQAVHRGELTFLHVRCDNQGAIGLYERMGFLKHQDRLLRIMTRES